MMKLYNTLTRKVEEFRALNPPHVGMYTCGPTVYDYTHIGHLRKYVGDDILRRVLEMDGFEVRHVMNITDVGHLVSDEDAGEDKMEKGAKQKNMTVWEVAKFFEEYFFKSTRAVNIQFPNVVCRATEHIKEQVKLIHKLTENGFTYQTAEAIYFDITKFPNYTQLSGQKQEDKNIGVRDEVIVDHKKKNPADFALWFFTVGRFTTHVMRWSSPLGLPAGRQGEGFPGWHIECSAMAMEYLGNTLDIHTGGIDHIAVHHTNEIAQSEGVTGKQFVRFWVHHNHLLVEGEKMSKSKGNFYTIDDITKKGFDPLALRYLFLTAHYRDEQNFTWKSLEASQSALNKLRELVRGWSESENRLSGQAKDDIGQFWQKFMQVANNDLNMPQAVGVLWEMVHSDSAISSKAATILQMDKILGLGLDEYVGKPIEVSKTVMKLVHQRETARGSGDFKKSDKLRHEIKKLGYEVEDTSAGSKVKKLT